MRVPGGKPVAIALGVLGFATTMITIVFSVMPGAEEPHKPLAIAKIIGLTLVLLALGVVAFLWGRSHSRANLHD